MSNFRVRQVLALGAMPERQLRLLIALATWMGDDTRTVRVGLETLIAESGKSHNTVRNARRELEVAGKLATQGGRGKGNLTVWTALCLPEKGVSDVDPHADPKGTSEVGTFSAEPKGTSEVGIFTPAEDPPKGTNQGPQKVPTKGSKRYQGQAADQQEPEMGFNSWANPLGSISLSAPASDGNYERENDSGDDDDDDDDELDPDAVLLAAAVPGAGRRDVEYAITTLQIRKHHGEIRTSVRAYLRGIIDKGDARSIVNEAAAQRRRDEADIARYGEPFGTVTHSPRTFVPTPTPPKFTAPPPADRPRPESIEAARAAISHLRRAPTPTGDPLRDLAAARTQDQGHPNRELPPEFADAPPEVKGALIKFSGLPEKPDGSHAA